MIRALLALLLLLAGASLVPVAAHGGHHHDGVRPVAAIAPAKMQAFQTAEHLVTVAALAARPVLPCHQPMQEGEPCCCASACVAVIAPPLLDVPAAPPRLAWWAGHAPAMQDFRRDPPRPPPRG